MRVKNASKHTWMDSCKRVYACMCASVHTGINVRIGFAYYTLVSA